MKEQETGPSSLREELTTLAGSDATLAHMLKTNRPLNLETYLAMEYPDGIPKTLSSEQISMIPEPLRRQSENHETEADGMRAEALRRSQVHQLFKARRGQTRDSSK